MEDILMALRKGWNVHNDIGMVLERIARNKVLPNMPYAADHTAFCAGAIEGGTFAGVMEYLLEQNEMISSKESKDFKCKLDLIRDKSVHDLEPEFAQSILDEFIYLNK